MSGEGRKKGTAFPFYSRRREQSRTLRKGVPPTGAPGAFITPAEEPCTPGGGKMGGCEWKAGRGRKPRQVCACGNLLAWARSSRVPGRRRGGAELSHLSRSEAHTQPIGLHAHSEKYLTSSKTVPSSGISPVHLTCILQTCKEQFGMFTAAYELTRDVCTQARSASAAKSPMIPSPSLLNPAKRQE